MQSELREAAYRICEDEDIIGAMGLVNHLVKVGFVKELSNKIIQTIVRSKAETALLSTFTDTTLEDESTILSAREREGSR
jgi:lipid A disaccharide synthetase